MRAFQLLLIAAATAASYPYATMAIETSAIGVEGPKAAIGALNIKMDTSLAAMQAMLTNVLNCNNQRKFYAPSDPRKDANSCVSQGSYEFTDTGTNSGDYGQIRMVAGNYGSFFRNDGTNTYLLLTNLGDQYGVWNGLRPLTVDNATGNVSIGTNLSVSGNVTGNSVGGGSVWGDGSTDWGGWFSGNNGIYARAKSATAWVGAYFDGGTNGDGVRGQASRSGAWGGIFVGPNGVLGQASGAGSWAAGYFDGNWAGHGVVANSHRGGSWAGYFDGTDANGVHAHGNTAIEAYTTTNNGWAGVFNAGASTGGVSINNNAGNAQLCLNGSCVTSLNNNPATPTPPPPVSPNGVMWGGSYIISNYGCQVANPFTGGCGCPSGYGYVGGQSGSSGGYNFYSYNCYKGTFHY